MTSLAKILSAASMIALSACGVDTTSQSEIAGASRTKTPAVIEQALATPVNAGINPSFAAYELTGRVMTGGNRCDAEGVKVKMEEKLVGDALYVTANLILPAGRESRICTREFMPQYSLISHTVSFDTKKVKSVFVAHVNELNNYVAISDLTSNEEKSHPAVIDEVTATPSNGGINPNSAALLVNARVMLGSNACVAGSNKAELVSTQVGKKLIVSAIIKEDPRAAHRICPMVFAPVFANLETVVAYDIMKTNSVVVANYKEMGRTVNINKFLQ